MGDIFVTMLDHSQTDIAFAQKVRRPSLHFSNTEVAKPRHLIWNFHMFSHLPFLIIEMYAFCC